MRAAWMLLLASGCSRTSLDAASSDAGEECVTRSCAEVGPSTASDASIDTQRGPAVDATVGADSSSTSAGEGGFTDGGSNAIADTGGGADAPGTDADAGACQVCGPACVDTETDPNNCGACGQICDGTCTGGRCVATLATGQNGAYALALDSANLYWTNFDAGTVMRMPLDGGTPVAIATGQTHPKFIAVDESNAYFTNDSTVMSVPLGGGSPVVLASGQISATGIAVDAESVYWTNFYGGSVRKVPLDGGRLGTLAVNQSAPFSIATNGSIACWTNSGDFGSVVKVALDGGAPVTVEGTASDYNPAGIAVDDANIYWAQSTFLGPVYRVAIDGGPFSVLATENGPDLLALDESTVYFSVPNGGPAYTGAIEKVPKDGGTTVILATTTLGQYPGPIAVDQTSVYWVNTGDGSIAKVTPK